MGIWWEKTKVFILGMRVTIDIFKDCNRFLYAKKEIVLKTFYILESKMCKLKSKKKNIYSHFEAHKSTQLIMEKIQSSPKIVAS